MSNGTRERKDVVLFASESAAKGYVCVRCRLSVCTVFMCVCLMVDAQQRVAATSG